MSSMISKLGEAGADINTTLERFMNNEAIYEKFLKKFLTDTNFEMLEKSMEEKNYEEALKYAHTLKGVGGNLGLTDIFKITETMVAKFRNGTLDGIDDDFLALKVSYGKMTGIIKEFA